jgi:hypothetical protein
LQKSILHFVDNSCNIGDGNVEFGTDKETITTNNTIQKHKKASVSKLET